MLGKCIYFTTNNFDILDELLDKKIFIATQIVIYQRSDGESNLLL